MQHEWNGLHLNRCRLEVARSTDVPPQVRGDVVAFVEIFKRGHCIWDVSSTHIDLVGITKCISLHAMKRYSLLDCQTVGI